MEAAIEHGERGGGVAPEAVGGDDGGDARGLAAVGAEIGQRRDDAAGEVGDVDLLVPQDVGDQAEGTRREGDVERQQRHVHAVHPDAVDLGRAVVA